MKFGRIGKSNAPNEGKFSICYNMLCYEKSWLPVMYWGNWGGRAIFFSADDVINVHVLQFTICQNFQGKDRSYSRLIIT